MNPPELETDSENYSANKSWRRVTRAQLYAKSLVRADGQDREGIWHLGPRPRQNMQGAGSARSASRLLGKASSRQSDVEAPPPGGQTDDDDRDHYPSNHSARGRSRTSPTGS